MPFAFNLNDVDDDDGEFSINNIINDADQPCDINIGETEPVTQKSTERGKKRRNNGNSSDVEPPKKRKQKAAGKTKQDTAPKVDKSCIVVSVDFGTTHSGASYRSNLHTSDNQIHTIANWPDGEKSGQCLQKMPTRIAYKHENKAWGSGKQKLTQDVIGYEVKPGMVSYTWFKLHLDQNADPTEFDDPNLESAVGKGALQLPKGKTALAVASDFLRILRCILMKELARLLTEEVLKETRTHFYITVPAIWDDKAQKLTHDALQIAGFKDRSKDEISIISEPEAAAVAALKQCHEQSSGLLKEGLCGLVVDLGGGTVDLECVRIEKLSPLTMKVIGVGNGGKCGSTTIDRNFIAHMMDTFGESFAAVIETKRGPGSAFMNLFEAEKKAFQGNLNETFRMTFPALAQQLARRGVSSGAFDDEENEVIITGQEMASFFYDTVDQVCRLIKRQIQDVKQMEGKVPDVVILAGGLSCSAYIFQHIKNFCQGGLEKAIQVLRPQNAWSAISHGAVAFGLDRTVMVSRQARRHYFMPAQRAFREGFDPEVRAVQCPIHGKRVRGELQSLLKKGEAIGEKTSRYLHGYIVMDNNDPEQLRCSYDIICSNADELPVWEGDPGTYILGKLHVDLNPVVMRWAKKGWSKHNLDLAESPVKVKFNIVVKGGHAASMLHVAANAEKMNVGQWEIDYTTQ